MAAHDRGERRAWLWLTAAAALLLACAALTPKATPQDPDTEEAELLLHAVQSERVETKFHMPLVSIFALGLRDHDSAPALRDLPFRLLLTALTVFSAGCLLLGAAPAAAAALIATLTATFSAPQQSIYALLILLTSGLMVWRARAPSSARTALLACALGATLICRSPLMYFPPLLALFEWASARRDGARPRGRDALILCLVPYLFLLPWALMNARVYGSATVMERGAAEYNMVYGAAGVVRTLEGDWASLLPPGRDKGTVSVLAWWLGEVGAHPLRHAGAVLKRLAYVFSLNPLLCLAACAGLWRHRRRNDFRQLALLCAYFLLVHCTFSVHEQYFIPLWLLLSLLAAGLLRQAGPSAEPSPRSVDYLFSERALLLSLSVLMLFSARALAVAHEYGRLALLRAPSSDEALEAAISAAPDDAWLTFERGERRLSRGRIAEAIADFEKATALRPDTPDWSLRLAWARMIGGDPGPLLAWRGPPARGGVTGYELKASVLRAQAHLRMGRIAQMRLELKRACVLSREDFVYAKGPERPEEKPLLTKFRATPFNFENYLPAFPEEDRHVLLRELTRIEKETFP